MSKRLQYIVDSELWESLSIQVNQQPTLETSRTLGTSLMSLSYGNRSLSGIGLRDTALCEIGTLPSGHMVPTVGSAGCFPRNAPIWCIVHRVHMSSSQYQYERLQGARK